jgi:hypothetical protein
MKILPLQKQEQERPFSLQSVFSQPTVSVEEEYIVVCGVCWITQQR